MRRRPPAKLEPADMIELNRRVLEETAFEGDRPHGVQNTAGLRRAMVVTHGRFLDDAHKRATLLCCALIANHPFNDGNHRTSLEAATLLLLMDGWLYTGAEEDEKAIYNWRFDYEEAHEAKWSSRFGGWDASGELRHLLELVESEYGRTIERFLRQHTDPTEIESILLYLPPARYAVEMRAYPPGPWKKELNRKRRANASHWRKTVWHQMEQFLQARETRRVRRKPQKHWRPEKL